MRVAKILLLALMGLGTASPIVAAESQNGISVDRPWARASIGTSRPAVAYMTIVNDGGEAARLVSIESPLAGRAAVHRTVMKDGIMRMEPAERVEVPSGKRVVLAPGGLHVMLMDLKQPLNKGGRLPLILHFASGIALKVTVPVMGPGARGPGK